MATGPPRQPVQRARPQSEPLTADGPFQPGPYYAIQTEHVLLVCIDTGIDGHVDPTQLDWLEDVSAVDKPKILLTGKPLVVDRTIEESTVPGKPGQPKDELRSVWKVVNNPEHQYVATIGGDIHNFQMYPRRPLKTDPKPPDAKTPDPTTPDPTTPDPKSESTTDGDAAAAPCADISHRPFVHIVSGGGGAFMHASHAHHTVANGDTLPGLLSPGRKKDQKEIFPSPPAMTFPNTPQSLRFFASRLIQGINRAMANLLMLLIGGVLGSWFGLWAPWPQVPVPASVVAGAALLFVAVVVRTFLRGPGRAAPGPRSVVTFFGSLAVGLLAAGLTYWLVPEHATVYLVTAAGLAVLLSFISAGARETRWWVPEEEEIEPPRTKLFWFGLLALALTLGLVQTRLVSGRLQLLWAIPAVVLFVVGVGGWWLWRRKHPQWQRASSALIPVLQVLITLTVVWQLARRFKLTDLYWSALFGGLIGVIVIVLASWAAVLVVSAVIAGFLRLRGAKPAAAWGRSLRLTWYCWNAILVGATVGWGALCAAGPGPDWFIAPPAFGLPAMLVALVTVLFVVDWLHRHMPQRYVWVVLALALGLVAVGWNWQWQSLWWAHSIVGAVLVIFGLLVGATMVHFSFLGVYQLIVGSNLAIVMAGTNQARLQELMPDEAVYDVFEKRERNELAQPDDPLDPVKVSNYERLLFGVRMTAPGLTHPGGPIQHLVSELFSSDVPPFYKSFLSFSSRKSDSKSDSGPAETR